MQKRQLYVVRYQVQPLPGSDNFAHCTGAFVNVWMAAATEQEALAIAAKEVNDVGWSIESLGSVHPTTRDDYSEDDSGLKYFEQALIDGVVLVFHSWSESTQH